MLESLSSTMASFKPVEFKPGLNVALAIRTKRSQSKASRNAVGKSSLVTLLDFALGADANRNHLTRRPELTGGTFQLRFRAGESSRAIDRSGDEQGTPLLDGTPLPLADLKVRLGLLLFELPPEVERPSYRSLVAFYLRDREAGGFQEPLRTHSRQSNVATYPALAYLLSLDADVSRRAQELVESKKQLAVLKKAVKDPIFGVATANVEELDAEITTLGLRIAETRSSLADFRVVDSYNDHRRRADALSERIRALNDRAAILTERERALIEALTSDDESEPDRSYVLAMYEQVGLAIPDRVVRTVEEVRAFHESVARNRREHVERELETASRTLTAVNHDIARLDDERSKLMVLLAEGGALETYVELQTETATLEGRRAALEERRESATSLKRADVVLRAKGIELEEFTRRDLLDRENQVEDLRALFASFAYEIYGADRPAALSIEPTINGYKLIPTLGGERSAGVAGIALFCFDLTVAVTAHRSGRGPDFLVHDSHLFDSVEERQVAAALMLAEEVCAAEGMQYIVTMNSDAFEGAKRFAPDLRFHTAVTLTDEYDTGGLFGIRFN